MKYSEIICALSYSGSDKSQQTDAQNEVDYDAVIFAAPDLLVLDVYKRQAQIDAERAALEEDLEAIRARAYPRGVRYDTPRVQSSPDPDGLLVKVADAIQRRTARTKRATDALRCV